MRVLKSRDQVWRAELWPDGWRLTMHGGLVLSRASLDRLVAYLLAHGIDAARDMVED